jgi:hypothetical protein
MEMDIKFWKYFIVLTIYKVNKLNKREIIIKGGGTVNIWFRNFKISW